LTSSDLNSPTPNVILELFAENRTSANLFPSCVWRVCCACVSHYPAALPVETSVPSVHFVVLNIISDRNIHSTVTDELNVERPMDVWIDRAAVRINTFR